MDPSSFTALGAQLRDEEHRRQPRLKQSFGFRVCRLLVGFRGADGRLGLRSKGGAATVACTYA